MAESVTLRFWGTRGSVPCFSGDKVRFGTNTSCLQIKWSPNEWLTLDAGTGIIALGDEMNRRKMNGGKPFHLFLSHFHWDHIHGLPFFKPVYQKENHIVIYGRAGVELVFTNQLFDPFSPVPLEALAAHIEYVQLSHETVQLGEARVEAFPLHHPQGCFGYVVAAGNRRVVYATDTEPDGGEMDELLAEKAAGADCLIMDSNNGLEEAGQRVGWGHSTWQDCVAIAERAGVHRLILFHNDPFHNDTACLEKESLAQRRLPNTLTAYDGMIVTV